MIDEQLILTGWKDIARVQGISVQRAKRRAERYAMPYTRLCGKVTIPRVVLVEWVRGLCKVTVGEPDPEMADEYIKGRMRNLKGEGKGKKKGL